MRCRRPSATPKRPIAVLFGPAIPAPIAHAVSAGARADGDPTTAPDGHELGVIRGRSIDATPPNRVVGFHRIRRTGPVTIEPEPFDSAALRLRATLRPNDRELRLAQPRAVPPPSHPGGE